jgi:hypothetical protein
MTKPIKTHLDMTMKELVLETFMRFLSQGNNFGEARMKTFKMLEGTLQMPWDAFKHRLSAWIAKS